jgi:hypothetical protein
MVEGFQSLHCALNKETMKWQSGRWRIGTWVVLIEACAAMRVISSQ